MSDKKRKKYALLDGRNTVLAKGVMETAIDAPQWQVRVLNDKIDVVEKREELYLAPIDEGGPMLLGRVIRVRNDVVILEKLKNLGKDLRQDVRVASHFSSFIYPIDGMWHGRHKIKAHDISSGGAAFFCAHWLEIGEQLELVVPITVEPLILRCQILRRRPPDQAGEPTFYAAKFVDLCNDEEVIMREAVFSVQVAKSDL